jgi:hypothetical protein
MAAFSFCTAKIRHKASKSDGFEPVGAIVLFLPKRLVATAAPALADTPEITLISLNLTV